METIEIVRVKFLWPAKLYEFANDGDLPIKRGDKVVVRRDGGGTMVGTVAVAPRLRVKRQEDRDLTPVVRLASEQDVALERVHDDFRKEVKVFFDTRVRARDFVGVRFIDCEKAEGGQRLVIYYQSEQRRFDAREISVELGYKFNLRIDMRSVGIRDGARLSGGIGKCGLSLCCSTWLPDFNQVSIRMAKDQGLSLEPESISGQCGRLLCCLGYEHENYVALGAELPKVGKVVITPVGEARVVKLDILKGMLTVRTEDGSYETFAGTDVKRKFGPGGRATEMQEGSAEDAAETDEELHGNE